MLKRQRQPSPPPSSSVPLVTDCGGPADHLAARDPKRRRTRPPVLDGASRGWNYAADDDDDENDDSVEDVDDYSFSDYNDTSSNRNLGHQDRRDGGPAEAAAGDEYRSTNNLLRELHILQKHRLLFSDSSPTLPPPPPSKLHPYPHPSSTLTSKYGHPPTHLQQPTTGGTTHHLAQKYSIAAKTDPTLASQNAGLSDNATLGNEEISIVHQHYNETNRLLRDLVLSRRREQDPPGHSS